MALLSPEEFNRKKNEPEITEEKESKLLSPKDLFPTEDVVIEQVEEQEIYEYILEEITTIQELLKDKEQNFQELKSKVESLTFVDFNTFNELKEQTTYIDDVKEQFTSLLKNLEESTLRLSTENYTHLEEKINSIVIPEVKYYDKQISELNKRISSIKIPEIPQVKYYDEEISELSDRLNSIQIPEVPEIKYYDEEISELSEKISSLKNYDDTELIEQVNLIQDVLITVNNNIETTLLNYINKDSFENLKSYVEQVKNSIPEIPEVRYYDNELKGLLEYIDYVKSIIPTVPEIPEVKYYDEDIKILEKRISKLSKQFSENQQVLSEKFESSPKPKYYDSDIKTLSERISQLNRNVKKLKENHKEPIDWSFDIEKIYNEIEKLKEQPVITEEKEQKDPLVPLEQNFVTFEDLAKHYRTFINRVQQQLSTLGGGGEVNLRYLDDIDRSSIGDGKALTYDAASGKFVFITIPGLSGISTSSLKIEEVDKTLDYYPISGSLSTVTDENGTKTFYYNNVGLLTGLTGTGIYKSKEFVYDGNDNLIFVNVL